MSFAAPLALLGLVLLPAIVFLIRLTPPPPRRVAFPPLALLRDLVTARRTPQSSSLWLLLLRLAAAAFVILGLAGPCWHQLAALPGAGPVLLVIDNGWSAAIDWPQRRAAANAIIGAAAAANRSLALLATAADASGATPHIIGLLTPSQATQIIATLQPQPWSPDRAGATRALLNAPETTRIYLADGVADGPDLPKFLKILDATRILVAAPPSLLLPPDVSATGDLIAHVANPPAGALITARTATGGIIASAPITHSTATIRLPLQLTRKVTVLALTGSPTAASIFLLNGSTRNILAGLATGIPAADTPYLGANYFIRRALPATSQIITLPFAALIAAHADLIILADTLLTPPQQAAAVAYLAAGGIILRFAGPLTAAAPDALAPDPLLPGDRSLGGALTWAAPQTIATFPATSPFAGLSPDPAAAVTRQILADPTTLDPATIWASLQDGTPLVLAAPRGKGVLITFLTTADAGWSTLPLSGLFPAMLARIAALAGGTASNPAAVLRLQSQLNAFGTLEPATTTASLTAATLGTTRVSPILPPGLYGTAGNTIALNLGGHVPSPQPIALRGAVPLSAQPIPFDAGPELIAVAILLLVADLTISLALRGYLTRRRLVLLATLSLAFPAAAHAQINPAVQPSLGYIATGNAGIDQETADGLAYIATDVSAHTSAQIAPPTALDAAVDDLAFYPLIYWLILPGTPPPPPAACDALTAYMQHGGILFIDTTGGDITAPGSGAGFAPGVGTAASHATACLALPPLIPLKTTDVLAHCFYIVQNFPGRFTGAPILIAAEAARDADDVSPVIFAQNDFAGAWARDATGAPEQTPIPDGEAQRQTADRFGTNLIIYALTGSYKADQGDVAATLDNLDK